jgi:bifunctional ADP-heptose synthase (sugar kinase/adenylyltransferase)
MDKMVIRDRYHGGDQVHMTNGSAMDIEHIGHVIYHASGRKIHLKNVYMFLVLQKTLYLFIN